MPKSNTQRNAWRPRHCSTDRRWAGRQCARLRRSHPLPGVLRPQGVSEVTPRHTAPRPSCRSMLHLQQCPSSQIPLQSALHPRLAMWAPGPAALTPRQRCCRASGAASGRTTRTTWRAARRICLQPELQLHQCSHLRRRSTVAELWWCGHPPGQRTARPDRAAAWSGAWAAARARRQR